MCYRVHGCTEANENTNENIFCWSLLYSESKHSLYLVITYSSSYIPTPKHMDNNIIGHMHYAFYLHFTTEFCEIRLLIIWLTAKTTKTDFKLLNPFVSSLWKFVLCSVLLSVTQRKDTALVTFFYILPSFDYTLQLQHAYTKGQCWKKLGKSVNESFLHKIV